MFTRSWQLLERRQLGGTGSGTTGSKKQKRQVTKETFDKWQRLYERDHQSITWLRCDVDQEKTLVAKLWCNVCRKYESNIRGLKNFSRAWLEGSGNHKTSSIVDHATSEQHKVAMMRLRHDQAKESEPIVSYSPIARSLMTMDTTVRERVKKKFDISYVLAKESMPFTKYQALHQLEQRHGVDLGEAYKTRESACSFVHYIAESQRQQFHHKLLSQCNFYSFLMDGSTDKAKVENELIVLLYCSKDDKAEEMNTCARYFTVLEPAKADGDGLVQCLGKALQSMGIEDLVDRASVKSLVSAKLCAREVS